MQSQQMFNDCIAKTQVSRSVASPQKGNGKFAVSGAGEMRDNTGVHMIIQ